MALIDDINLDEMKSEVVTVAESPCNTRGGAVTPLTLEIKVEQEDEEEDKTRVLETKMKGVKEEEDCGDVKTVESMDEGKTGGGGGIVSTRSEEDIKTEGMKREGGGVDMEVDGSKPCVEDGIKVEPNTKMLVPVDQKPPRVKKGTFLYQ